MKSPHRLTQHIRYGLTPLPFGTLLLSGATSHTPEPLYEVGGVWLNETERKRWRPPIKIYTLNDMMQ